MTSLVRLACLGLLCLLGACHDSAGDKPPTPLTPAASKPASPKPRIALVMKTLTNPFFIEMEKGARDAESKLGVELDVRTGGQETAIEQQIEIVETEITNKVDAIVIAPGDSKRLIPVLKKAQDAGIVVVNIDNRLDQQVIQSYGMKPVPFVSVDNEAASYEAAKYLVGQVRGRAKAVILEGIRSAENARLRSQGAERAFVESSNVELVAKETANWKINEAHDVIRKLFSANPDIGVVFCSNDMMAIGVIQYLQETGRRQVLVGGYDALDEARQALRTGEMRVTVDQKAREQGYLGVELALKALHKQAVPDITMVSAKLVTANDAK